MKSFSLISVIILSIGLITGICACSGNSSPVTIEEDVISMDFTGSSDCRAQIGAWHVIINPEQKTMDISPIARSAAYHFSVSDYYPNALSIVSYHFGTPFTADIKLSHPLPGSGIDVYDPRVIAVLPARDGVSFNYPEFNITANNSVVLDPDGYTKTWDDLSIEGNTNPFIAYFKNQPNHVWSSTGVISETIRWEMDLNGFGGPMEFYLVVDVSTNYPANPQPVIDNLKECYKIDANIEYGLTPTGGQAGITVRVADWQGLSTINAVMVEAPDLFNGTVRLAYSNPGPNPGEFVFNGIIENALHAPTGKHGVFVAVKDKISGAAAGKEFMAIVGQVSLNPIDITPPDLNKNGMDIYIDGDYAYVAAASLGMSIYDLSNPSSPEWVSSVETPAQARAVCASGSYAYFLDFYYGLYVVDVDPPENAHVVANIPFSGIPFSYDIDIDGNNLFTMSYDHSIQASVLNIFDISDPLNPFIAKSVEYSGSIYLESVDFYNGYIYAADAYYSSGVRIIDVYPIEDAGRYWIIPNLINCRDVKVADDIAYVVTATAGVYLFDVSDLSSIREITSLGTQGRSERITVKDKFVYVTEYENFNGIEIIDARNPSTASVIHQVDLPPWASAISISGDYAYVSACGLNVIDISQPSSAEIVSYLPSSNSARGVFSNGDLTFIADWQGTLVIYDTDPVSESRILKTVTMESHPESVKINGNYAYIASSAAGLYVIDVSDPSSASISLHMDTPGSATDLAVSSEYVYIADKSSLMIIDINPLSSAHIENSVATPGDCVGLFYESGIAYVADGESGLSIIDVDPATTAFILKTVDTMDDAASVLVEDGYAYVADNQVGVDVIDVDPISSAYQLLTVPINTEMTSLETTMDYVIAGNRWGGIHIINIVNPESAFLVDSIGYAFQVYDIQAIDNRLFVAGEESGLRILQLW